MVTDEQYLAVCEIVSEYRSALGLEEWSINVDSHKPTSKNAAAQIHYNMYIMEANIRLSKDFWNGDNHYQRTCLLHELMHIKLARITSILTQDLKGAVNKSTFKLLYNTVERHEEEFVDGMSYALTQSYRLPKIPKAKKKKGKKK